jgi:UDP-N-acetylmuramoyl-L-alanyl-D-glutamate--2,6-diaminopimelate ligase
MTTLRDVVDSLQREGQLLEPPGSFPPLLGVADDSRRVSPGALFCAVVGTTRDGHEYLDDAIRRGAAALLVTRPGRYAVPAVVVRDSRVAAAVAAATWFGSPARRLRMVGVTGTNGKSTTVALMRHLLNQAGTVGSVGTLGAFDGRGAAAGPEISLTTPGAVEYHAVLAALAARGVTMVVTEASSHALDQRRLHGVEFAAAVYTNLTHDHLDYHKDLQAYLAAKLLLSTQVQEGGVEAVNGDDRAWDALPPDSRRRRVTYAVHRPADVRASDIKLGAEGTELTMSFGKDTQAVRLPLIGEFNVSNALAAAATAWGLGLRPAEAADRLAGAPQVPGRMERLASDGFVVLRDYAHTPDALERAIRALRPLARGRLIVLFGCGGDRDRRKRSVMGRIAARGADLPIVTSDNPRSEDADAIIDEIEAGMEGIAHLRITDRREAITRAISLLQPGDCLLLAGKGHETYQIIGDRRLPFDEREIVRDLLARPVRP